MLFRIAIALALLTAACSVGDAGDTTPPTTAIAELVDSNGAAIPPAPEAPSGPVADVALAAVDSVWMDLAGGIDPMAIAAIGGTGDVRLAWLLSDLLRFFPSSAIGNAAFDAFVELAGLDAPESNTQTHWRIVTDYLIAWDTPAPPGYVAYKEQLFTLVEPRWHHFFADEGADIDWRLISWGGVLIDDRSRGDQEGCERGCIPAIDDPPVTSAADGSWYHDDRVVFGVVVNGEARAYPKNMMEVHEMVNDTVGGRRIGMPYCTLCGSAQAFYTDVTPDGFGNLTLRTSGLLSRSNKVMYDLDSKSVFDTFLGVALSGPLHDEGFVLEPVSVVVSTWGEWKEAHPGTTIVARDGGRGITYPDDPLRGRDDNGPIFPVGNVDPRLPVQEQVLGVVDADGTVIAFPVAAATAQLAAGRSVVSAGIELVRDGGGLRAFDGDGEEVPSHQAFWFAWSQFQPETLVWMP